MIRVGRTLLAASIALAALLGGNGAAAQSNVPPPPHALPAPGPQRAGSSVTADALASPEGYRVTNAVDKVNTATKVIIDGAEAAMGHADDLHLVRATRGLTYAGYALKASKIATAQPGRERWEAVGDMAVGACLDLACLNAGPAAMACSAAVACADSALEISSGKSLGSWAGSWAYDNMGSAPSAQPEPVADRRPDLRARFAQRQSSDSDYAAQAAAPVYRGGYESSYDDGGAASFGALLGAFNTQMTPRTPMTPIVPPTASRTAVAIPASTPMASVAPLATARVGPARPTSYGSSCTPGSGRFCELGTSGR